MTMEQIKHLPGLIHREINSMEESGSFTSNSSKDHVSTIMNNLNLPSGRGLESYIENAIEKKVKSSSYSVAA